MAKVKTIEDLDRAKLPQHIAIIMDGNGRWAKNQGEERIFGHQNGVRAVRQVTEACAEIGVGYLTLYAFSTENWNRPKAEVNALMELLVHTISAEMPTLMKNNISLHAIGDIGQLPESTRKELQVAIEGTAGNTGLSLVLALSYSARWDILNAVKKIVASQPTEAALASLTESDFKEYLTTSSIPDPELMIRTSGEQRISNFLLWELAYTELFFTEKMWPDFDKEDLYEAIYEFQKRERRFGKTGDQISVEQNS